MPPTCDWCSLPITASEAVVHCAHEAYSDEEMELMGLEAVGALPCGRAIHAACHELRRATCGVCNHGAEPTCWEHTTKPGVLCMACQQWHIGPCVVDPTVTGFACRGCEERMATRAEEQARREARIRVAGAPLDVLKVLGRLAEGADEESRPALVAVLELVRAWQRDPVRDSERPMSIRALLPTLARLRETSRRIEGPLEQRMFELLADAGWAADFEAQAEIEVDVVQPDGSHLTRPTWPDFVHRHLPLAIYVDGHSYHGDPETMARDHELVARLSARGYRVRRFLRWQLEQQPRMVIAAVQHEIAELQAHRYALRPVRARWPG